MIRIPGKIPITITPAFWIFAIIIGILNSMSVIGTVVWVGIIFVSVLFHELGHAITALCFGQKPRIELVALGGMTFHIAERLPFWKQFFIVFNGPLFGFLLFLGCFALSETPPFNQGLIGAIVTTTQWVNLFWTVLNLLPILPLDGGQLLRIPLEAFFGIKGFKYALAVSMVVALLLSMAAFLYQYFLVGAILFLFAYQSFDSWKRSRIMSDKDRDEGMKQTLQKGEQALQAGDKVTAKASFEEILSKVAGGVTYLLAVQYLAFLYYEEGDLANVYKLLQPVYQELPIDSLCLLHCAAFHEKDYSLVQHLAGKCFQVMPSADTALRSAYASAALNNPQATIGWLEAALDEGLQNVKEIALDKNFDPVRDDPMFQQFIQSKS